MKFLVTVFDPQRGAGMVVFDGVNLGLDHLDRARQETGVPELDPELLYSDVSGFRQTVHVEISEAMARASGYFATQNVVRVTITEGIEELKYLDASVQRSDKTGEVTAVRFWQKFDKDKFRRVWADAGYPLELAVPSVDDEDEPAEVSEEEDRDCF